MSWIVKAIIGLSVPAFVSVVPAHSQNLTRLDCPSGYAMLGGICISASSGDIVLPATKAADASSQAKAGR